MLNIKEEKMTDKSYIPSSIFIDQNITRNNFINIIIISAVTYFNNPQQFSGGRLSIQSSTGKNCDFGRMDHSIPCILAFGFEACQNFFRIGGQVANTHTSGVIDGIDNGHMR